MHSFYLKTFGCKTNQYEEQGIREALLAAGWSEAARLIHAQVLILNTCTVTGQASGHCRRFAGQALRENPQLRLILTGCAADAADDWLKEYPFEAIFPNTRKPELVAYLIGSCRNTGSEVSQTAGETKRCAAGDGFGFSLQGFTGHTRAFLKIQDGCANCCSYCIIPSVRGAPRSRPADAVLQEARQLIARGYRELVLTGINIGQYADDAAGLAGLVRQLAALEGLQRLRLGSVEPQTVTPALLDALRESDRICPHLHLPLQAGDDGVLRAMNRRYTTAEFLRTLDAVRAALPRPAITTDLITGFPGETGEQFAATCSFVKQAAFARAHIFIFSPRQNTPAAILHARQPCPRSMAEERHRILTEICAESAMIYAAGLSGIAERVMLERKTPEGWTGYCGRYLRTVVVGGEELRRVDCPVVRIDRAEGTQLFARI